MRNYCSCNQVKSFTFTLRFSNLVAKIDLVSYLISSFLINFRWLFRSYHWTPFETTISLLHHSDVFACCDGSHSFVGELKSILLVISIFLVFTMALCSESSRNQYILGFHYGIMQWIWRGVNYFKCVDAYAVLEWENDTEFQVFPTKHKANT
jgi:hypothetical protein